MFSSRKKGNLGTKLFVLSIIALFIYGYVLDEDNINYFKNFSLRNNSEVAEETDDPSNNNEENNNKVVNNPSTNNSNTSNDEKVISIGTKMICKTYDKENNDITTDEMSVPDEIINLSIEDAKKYINEHYSNWIINEINENYIEVYQTSEPVNTEPYYLIQEKDGKIYIYEFDEAGNKKMIQETSINFNFLSEVDQDYFREGIIKYDIEEVQELLQDFES
ncbi:MAG: hypothetical protein MJA31_05070 [Clostridia bacterium]|nr:hypothetical protein [Clostridia bacterium]